MQFDMFENPAAVPEIEGDVITGPSPIEYHRTLPGYASTPLYDVPQIADELGVAKVLLKDESSRLGLPAFKMLGASWAVAYAVRRQWLPEVERVLSPQQLGELIPNRSARRLVAATDGNHGRGVARMAKMMGISCVIFVPESLAPSRVEAIRSEGAEVRVVAGSYDDAIRSSAASGNQDSIVVSDTSWEGYRDIPRQVTHGYQTMFTEVDEVVRGGTMGWPTVLALQAGVGAFAASGLLHYRGASAQSPRPRCAIVEPLTANCLLRSARAGRITQAPPPHPSRMEGLNCGWPSELTWPVIQRGADVFLGIDDDATFEAMRLLAANGIVAGESGAAGLGGLLAVARQGTAAQRDHLGLTPTALVLLVNTEGATDPINYEYVVGVPPTQIESESSIRRDAAGATRT
ncbi:MAG: diaminopropionate ammonia-lyase [Arachnia sp.]